MEEVPSLLQSPLVLETRSALWVGSIVSNGWCWPSAVYTLDSTDVAHILAHRVFNVACLRQQPRERVAGVGDARHSATATAPR